MLRHLDLFSGIGGFALAARMVGGYETVGFCEIEPYCQAVLRKHWPRVKIHDDINRLSGIPLSGLIAGWQTGGVEWNEERPALCPDWLVIENAGHTWRRWVPELRGALHGLGYASVPFRVRAANLGARHLRTRIFVVAHADSIQLRKLSRWWHGPGREMAAKLAEQGDYAPRGLGANDGVPYRLERTTSLGNAIVPQVAAIFLQAIKDVTA
jgi:DNA (cytosine-5)-methyltransferase 1